MADVEIEDSSPSTLEPFHEISLDSLTEKQYENFRLTGEVKQEAKTAEPPPAKKTIEEPAAGEPPKGNQEAGKGKGVKSRSAELDTEIQELEAKLARRTDLKRQLESEPGAPKTEPPPVTETKPAELKRPVKPKSDDFKTWEEYETANDKYLEDLTDFKTATALQQDREQRKQEAEKAKQLETGKTVADAWNKRIEETAKRVGAQEWNKAANAVAEFVNPATHPEFAAGSSFILESEAGADVMHYLGTHLDELKEIVGMSPLKQIRAMTLIESSLSEKPAPRREPPPPGPKRITEVPPPPTDVAGRGAPPKDPVAAALEADDFEAFLKAANARDVAAKRRVLG